jgi:hypothetical protein
VALRLGAGHNDIPQNVRILYGAHFEKGPQPLGSLRSSEAATHPARRDAGPVHQMGLQLRPAFELPRLDRCLVLVVVEDWLAEACQPETAEA